MQLSLATLILGLTATVSAFPHVRRDETTCGDQYYSASEVSEAADAACQHFQDGTDVNDYPHTYNNYEGFEFKGYDGPFQEFPIVTSGVYDGGKSPPNKWLWGNKMLTWSKRLPWP